MALKKIMFVSYGGGHANIARLIYQGLKKRNDVEIKVLALTVAGKIFDQYHVPYKTSSCYLDLFEDMEQIRNYGQRLAQTCWNQESGIAYEDSVAYLGFGYRDLVGKYGEEKAEYLFQQKERKAFWPEDVMKTILLYEKPDALVITCGVRSEGAAGTAANRLGIPVIRIADLPTYDPSNCDCMLCVMNEYARQFAIKEFRIKEEKITITGQPVFEDNLVINKDSLDESRHKIRIDSFDKMILYLEEPGVEETKEVEKCLKEIAAVRTDLLFVFKMHPNQDLDKNYWESDNILVVRDFRLKDLLFLCDLAITKDSTAGMEAVLMGKPLINLMLSDSILDYSEYRISERVLNLTQLPVAINECLDEESEIYLNLKRGRESFANKQNAVENIIEVILNEIKNQNERKI
jgi:UDP-N-acetylglucosamine 2-epimerase